MSSKVGWDHDEEQRSDDWKDREEVWIEADEGKDCEKGDSVRWCPPC